MKKNTLPVFGVGPIYAVSCIILTVLGLFLKKKGFLDSGELPALKQVAMVIGGLLIFIGITVWIYAVIIQKISDEIKVGHLVTSGIYSIVRNPIYLAFLCVCTGVLITAHNVFLQTEEKWLLEKFGTEYAEYCKHVNRVIPWFRH